jgi:hypothetical protein
MREIFDRHHVGRRYISKNYKEALGELENRECITCEPQKGNRRKDTFGDNVRVTFPTRGEQ